MKRTRSKDGAPAENDLSQETIDAITNRVLDRLAAALGSLTATPYSTRGDGERPPHYVHRAKAWRKVAPSIPGAVKVGRWWSVSRRHYDSWIASRAVTAKTVAPKPLRAVLPIESTANVNAFDTFEGLRPVRSVGGAK